MQCSAVSVRILRIFHGIEIYRMAHGSRRSTSIRDEVTAALPNGGCHVHVVDPTIQQNELIL